MDIVGRLQGGVFGIDRIPLCKEAADEIARLRDELTAARKTNSEWLASNGPGGWINDLRDENAKLLADAEKWREREAKIASLKARGFLGSPLRDAAMQKGE